LRIRVALPRIRRDGARELRRTRIHCRPGRVLSTHGDAGRLARPAHRLYRQWCSW
jgi:hypothetical protein